MNVHIVVKGDTLWKIARQYGISFEELKKVNAHLANPDYIVPGMKIFLPEGGKHHEKHGGKEKQPHHQEKPMKPESVAPPVPPVQKPMHTPPKHEVKPQPPTHKPTPKPEMKPTPKPTPPPAPPKPEMKPEPMPVPVPVPVPMPMPVPVPMPPTPPAPQPPVCETPPPPAPPAMQHPMVHPMYIGIPCGWMPIYDADCHPNAYPMHHHMNHQMPPQMMPQYPMPQQPMPPQWQMKPESSSCPDESAIMPGQGPGMSPSHCDSMNPWESPEHQMPKMESSSFDLAPPAYCPPESGYVPQQMPQQMPPQGYQQQYPNQQAGPIQGIQANQHPHLMHLCTSCGGSMSPTPYYGAPMMGVHPYYGGYPQMAYPQQGNYEQNQPGSY
ncbi:SafA/ExsA family spore coat assembly protein [Sporosarcina sp. A2]|uniref:SafA/ExsA family spore coat assembly protein n=1 Tax=Sporosarcina sp. A2 TaxID=3393449 RepID=UPI003D7A0B18